MNCKICKTEIPDDSIYCGICGARTDGKKTCVSCKNEIDENYIYCNYCGARVDGKKVCECGNLYEGNFCFLCGKGQEVSPADKKKKAVSTAEGSLTKKIFSIISGAVATLCAVLSLIFVFFIGFKLEIPVSISSLGFSTDIAETNIYYYFGKYFQETEGFAETLQYEWFQKLFSSDITLYGVLGIIVCSLTLLTVIGFSITALILYVLGWFGKTKARSEKWSVAAVVSFFVGVAAIYSLNKVSLSVSGQISAGISSSMDAVVVMNGATKAAAILIAVFAGIFFLCNLLKYNWGAVTKKSVLVSVFSFVGVAFAIVLLCVGANIAQSVIMSEKDAASISISLSGIPSNLLWTSIFSGCFDNRTVGYTEATEALMAMNVCNAIAHFCVIGILVLVGVAFCQSLNNSEKNVSSIVCSSVALALSVVVLVLSIVSFERLWDSIEFVGDTFVDTKTTFTTQYAPQIVTIVFTALLMVASIMKAVFAKMKEKNE